MNEPVYGVPRLSVVYERLKDMEAVKNFQRQRLFVRQVIDPFLDRLVAENVLPPFPVVQVGWEDATLESVVDLGAKAQLELELNSICAALGIPARVLNGQEVEPDVVIED